MLCWARVRIIALNIEEETFFLTWKLIERDVSSLPHLGELVNQDGHNGRILVPVRHKPDLFQPAPEIPRVSGQSSDSLVAILALENSYRRDNLLGDQRGHRRRVHVRVTVPPHVIDQSLERGEMVKIVV